MNIKIFMCCHNGYNYVPPLCVPIQCGAALNPPIKGTIPDNIGDNISDKNRQYCELTAHYYAWKNIDADYYGFCHYRRFFCFNEEASKPYLVRNKLSENDVKLLGSKEQIQTLAENYDVIVPKSEDMGLSVKQHYDTSKFHHAEDLELFIRILKEECPEISDTADIYLSQNKQYFCNMFIMKKELFFDYCKMLFDVMGEFDKQKQLTEKSQMDRTDGYLGEIFTGIFINHKIKQGFSVKEIRRLDTECSLEKKLGYRLLPPESKRRFWCKKVITIWRKNYYG